LGIDLRKGGGVWGGGGGGGGGRESPMNRTSKKRENKAKKNWGKFAPRVDVRRRLTAESD